MTHDDRPEDAGTPEPDRESGQLRPTRRGLLQGALGGAIGFAAGAGSGAAVVSGTAATPAARPGAGRPQPVPASGCYQAGIHLPASPQLFGRIAVLEIGGSTLGWLAALGRRVIQLTEDGDGEILPDGPGDLTISVGIGPRLVRAADPTIIGTTDLPAFAGDEGITPGHVGGDVLLAVHSSDPTVLAAVVDDLALLIPESTRQWEQATFRGAGVGTKARNTLGFMDGVIVPRTSDELDRGVWVTSGPLAGGTVCVIRRLAIDTTRFRTLDIGEREGVIGRTLTDGAPLSGGGPDDQIDLNSKTPEGEFIVPAHAHARAAHPSFTGSELMLRRSYSYDNGVDSGLVFISFQNDLRTFVATQQRLDEMDALMKFTRPTASGTFLVLPGFDAVTPLGAAFG
ncbi:dye decolorizing peroxidase [Salinibacterium sp. CAN_S4]|uniref:Dyp-type peroxidase n=1 Tax=Salinibacterium sp. CAN_S4 TaxID=2787727 RepID=UPI0018EFF392